MLIHVWIQGFLSLLLGELVSFLEQKAKGFVFLSTPATNTPPGSSNKHWPPGCLHFHTGFTFPMFASQIEHLLQRSLLFAGRTTHHPAHPKLPRGDMVVRPRICCNIFGVFVRVRINLKSSMVTQSTPFHFSKSYEKMRFFFHGLCFCASYPCCLISTTISPRSWRVAGWALPDAPPCSCRKAVAKMVDQPGLGSASFRLYLSPPSPWPWSPRPIGNGQGLLRLVSGTGAPLAVGSYMQSKCLQISIHRYWEHKKKEWFRSVRNFLGCWSFVTIMKKRCLSSMSSRHLKHTPVPTSGLCLFQTFDTSEADSGHTCQHVIWFISEKGYVVLHPLIDIISRIVQLLVLTFHFVSFFANKQNPKRPPWKKNWVFPTARGFCLGLCLSICVEFVEFRT